ncbi:MAG: hypothetical protein P8046_06090, partial [Anaerolineales bacterium]
MSHYDDMTPRERMEKRRKRSQRIMILAVVMMLMGLTILLPPIRTRVANKLDDWRTRFTYWLNPPDEAVFVPEEQDVLATMVAATLAAYDLTPSPEPTATATLPPNSTPLPTPTQTIAPTPLPESVDLP